MEDMHTKQKQAMDNVKAIIEDDGLATINGTDYKFTTTTHKKRRKVFAFFTKVAGDLQRGDFSFLDSAEWDRVEELLSSIVLVTEDEVQLSKMPNWWEEHAGDYLKFVSTALPVVCYPFLEGSLTN